MTASRSRAWTERRRWLAILFGSGLLPVTALAQLGPATGAGVRSMEHAAEQGVAQDALARAHASGNHGGCRPLPAGWAEFDATVDFPKAYAGYPAWVNFAELVPGNADVKAYVAGTNPPGVLMRPALRAGAMAVRSHMCAPAGRSYWLVVDSGMAKVAIGRIDLGAPPGPYTFALMAPPLGQQPRSSTASNPQPAPAAASKPTSQLSTTTGAATAPKTSGWTPPTTDNGWKPPTTDNSWTPPTTDSNPPFPRD